jgi:hypothetical protein
MSEDSPASHPPGGRPFVLPDLFEPGVHRRQRRETLELFAQVLLHRFPFPCGARGQLVPDRLGNVSNGDLNSHGHRNASVDSIMQARRARALRQ